MARKRSGLGLMESAARSPVRSRRRQPPSPSLRTAGLPPPGRNLAAATSAPQRLHPTCGRRVDADDTSVPAHGAIAAMLKKGKAKCLRL
jgi:hypothetical protein